MSKYYKDNRDKLLEKATKYAKENPSVRRKAVSKWKGSNPQSVLEYSRKHAAKYTSEYRARKSKALPTWLSELDRFIISEIYQQRLDVTVCTGIKHHVDHIVPLKGKSVCGLHVPWNLQIITATENVRKHNLFEV